MYNLLLAEQGNKIDVVSDKGDRKYPSRIIIPEKEYEIDIWMKQFVASFYWRRRNSMNSLVKVKTDKRESGLICSDDAR